jgi:hypothetical protein
LVSGANAEGETDWGRVVCGIWDLFCCSGLGAEGVVVCVGDSGAGGGVALVCGASGDEEWAREIDGGAQITKSKSQIEL